MADQIRVSIVDTLADKISRGADDRKTFAADQAGASSVPLNEDRVFQHVLPGQHLARIRVELIAPAPEGQARQAFSDDRLQALAESVKRSGIREPIIVTPHGAEPGRFQIVAGERRWRAAQMAGLAEIPCIVDPHLVDRKEKLLAQAEENIHRENLNAVEEAAILVQLMESRGLDAREAGELIGKSHAQARRLHQLHNAAAPIKRAVVRGQLDARAALEMSRIFNRFAREDETPTNANALRRIEKLIERAVREQWSIRKLENHAAKLVGRGEADPEGTSAAEAAKPGREVAGPKEPASHQTAPATSESAGPPFRESDGHLVIEVTRIARGGLDAHDREKLIALLEDLLARARRA